MLHGGHPIRNDYPFKVLQNILEKLLVIVGRDSQYVMPGRDELNPILKMFHYTISTRGITESGKGGSTNKEG